MVGAVPLCKYCVPLHCSRCWPALAAAAQSLLDVARAARDALLRGDSPSSLRRSSVGLAVGGSPPQVAALLVFEEISHITRVGLRPGRGCVCVIVIAAILA